MDILKLNVSDFRIIESTDLTDGSTQAYASIELFGKTGENHPYLYNFEYTLAPTGGTYGTNGYIRIIRQPKFKLFDGKLNTAF